MKKKWMMIFLLCLLLTGCRKDDINENPNGPDDPVIQESSFAFDLVDYTVYKQEEFPFVFVFAKVRIRDDASVNFSLKDIVTSEQIRLSETEEYHDKLDRLGVSLGKYNIATNRLYSDQNSAVFTLFVPVKDTNAEKVTLSLKEKSLDINLTKNKKTMLLEQGDELDVIEENNFSISIHRIFDVSGQNLYYKNEITSLPSTAELVAIELTIRFNGTDSVIINDAEYVTMEKGDSFTALEKEYDGTDKTYNLIGSTVTKETTGHLLFLTLNPEKEDITFKGILRLKINDNWYNVEIGD